MNKTSKTLQRRERQAEIISEALQRWFHHSGTTMQQLIGDIERLQPGHQPTDHAGLHPELCLRVADAPICPDWKIVVLRAMQHLAITRPWRDKSPEEPKQDTLL